MIAVLLLTAAPVLQDAPPAPEPAGPPLPDRLVARLDSAAMRHADVVTFAAFAPMGEERVVSGSADGTLGVWRAKDGAALGGHGARGNSIRGGALSPDGEHVALALAGGAVEVRGLADGASAFRVESTGSILVYSPDGRRLAASGLDEALRLLDAATGATLATVGLGDLRAGGVAFARDGKTLAAVGINRRKLLRRRDTADQPTSVVFLVDPGTGEVQRELALADRVAAGLAFTPTGELVACTDDGGLVVWDAKADQPEVRATGAGPRAVSFALAPNGERAAIGLEDGGVRLLRVADGELLGAVSAGGAGVGALGFSPDGRRLVAASGFLLRAWDVPALTELAPRVRHEGPVAALSFSPDGAVLASGSYDRTVIRWNVAERAPRGPRARRRVSPGFVYGVAHAGPRLATVGQAGLLRLWEDDRDEPVLDLVAHGAAATGVAASPDGAALATVGADRMLAVWDAATGEERFRVGGLAGVRFAVAFAPDSARVAVAGSNFRIVDAATGDVVVQGPGLGAPATALAWRGERLALGLADRSVRLVDPATGESTAVLRGHSGRVTAVALRPDGAVLASAAAGETDVVLWSTETGEELGRLGGLSRDAAALAWSPDGAVLAAGALDGSVVLFGSEER